MIKLGVIGSGIIGSALAVQLNRKGFPVVAASSKHKASAEKMAGMVPGCAAYPDNQAVADAADLVFITTPDDVIADVAAHTRWRKGQMVAHCSGADSTEILGPVIGSGAYAGVFHPLQSFAEVKQALENIPGSTFALEAVEPLMSVLVMMAEALGGYWIEVKSEDKTIYHTAAVIASNYLVTLVKISTDLWQDFGVPQDEAIRALLPLIKGTVHNIETIGLPDCLTGPIARGDSGTVKKHLEAIREKSPDLLDTYKDLGLMTIPIAQAKGKVSKHQMRKLKDILKAV